MIYSYHEGTTTFILEQKEGKDNIFGIGFENIYEGNDNTFETVGLKQKTL